MHSGSPAWGSQRLRRTAVRGLFALLLIGVGPLIAAHAAEPDDRWLDANGASLHFRIDGLGTQTLVLIHEMGTSLAVWDEVVPRLPAEVRVIRYDVRGFGLSEKLHGPIDFGTEVADLDELLDALHISKPVTLAGSALGAAIALKYAAVHPERSTGVIAIGPAAYLSPRPDALAQAEGLMSAPLGNRVRGEMDDIYPPSLRAGPGRLARFIGVQMAADAYSLSETAKMLARASFENVLPRIRCPVWYVSTTLYKGRDPESVRVLTQRTANARYVALKAGHLAPLESPEAVADLLTRFIDGQPPP